ncbi:TetR/AcrR family transcriptional regulator [Thermopolyspora sp. NPDC052614]|uniref:TetR/AcrR family transcriptional regulator n=1 Tax=Thermopolyspora sp. NPDC052614 TaxID=3155682 RepID=UPI0034444800
MGRGNETRERLLEAAAALIGEVGWNGVTTRLAAERAGVNQALVHYHFSSVTDLLAAAATAYIARLLDEALARLADTRDADDLVTTMLAELSRYTGDDPASLLVIEAYLASTRVPGLRERLAGLIETFRDGLADLLRAHGHTAEAEACATVLGAAMDGLVLYRSLNPEVDLAAFAGPLRRMLGTDERTTP